MIKNIVAEKTIKWIEISVTTTISMTVSCPFLYKKDIHFT